MIVALQAGHDWAYEAIVRLYGGRLLSVARRFTKNDADAQDVLQSAYLNAFRAIGGFEGQLQLSTSLHRIVVNTALMKLRTKQRKPEESIETLLPNFLEDRRHAEPVAGWTTPADVLLQQRETRRRVRKCIEQLPPLYRGVLILRDIEERSTQEAAVAFGTSRRQSKSACIARVRPCPRCFVSTSP